MNPFRDLRQRRGGAGRRGTAAVEFALVLPLLALLFAGTAEVVIYMRTWFRLERTAAEVANAASQFEALAPADVAGLFNAAKTIASPILAWSDPTGTGARTLIGVVAGTTSGNAVRWTCSRGDPGLNALVAGQAALPNGFVVPNGQTVLVVEVINAITPWSILASPVFLGSAGPGPVRTYVVIRPRLGTFASLGGACP